MIEGARQLPTQHLTVRVPWHDVGWNGSICENPSWNSSCLILKNIAENRNDIAEDNQASVSWKDLDENYFPPCVTENAGFMAPFEYTRTVEHPYVQFSPLHTDIYKPTKFTHKPYCAAAVPYAWMLRENVDGNVEAPLVERFGIYGYHTEREPTPEEIGMSGDNTWVQDHQNQQVLFDTFFSGIEPEESLCFFYAKRTPLSESPRRVIIGVGKVKKVEPNVEYEYYKPAPEVKLRSLLWERNVHHSIRPGFEEGFVFPYQQILEKFGNESTETLESYVAFAPDEYFENYSYGSELLPHEGAVASIDACVQAIEAFKNEIPGPWDTVLTWLDAELNRLWKMRGPFPGFGSALTALGIEKGTLLAGEVQREISGMENPFEINPWVIFEQVVGGEYKSEMLDNLVTKGSRKLWNKLPQKRKDLLKLLSRFSLSRDQMRRAYDPYDRENFGITLNDDDVFTNPYALFEQDRYSPDTISFDAIDRGMLPESYIASAFPVPEPAALESSIDERRIRALVIRALIRATDKGHTLQPRKWVLDAIQDSKTQGGVYVSSDILKASENFFSGVISIKENKLGDKNYQLEDIDRMERRVRKEVERRCGPKAKPHKSDYNYREEIDAELLRQGITESGEELEENAREEKAAALKKLYESRLSVLVGSAGTGKTTVLKALTFITEVCDKGVLLLAPTGKARVRLQQGTEQKAQTIAQFLLSMGRYDVETGRYLFDANTTKFSEYATVIIDECSMLTLDQLAALFPACKNAERIILSGDPRQLPPIGLGRPFVDIVNYLDPSDGTEKETGTKEIGEVIKKSYAELTIGRRQGLGEDVSERDDLTLAEWFSRGEVERTTDEIWSRLNAGEHSDTVEAIRWDSEEELQHNLFVKMREELDIPDDEKEALLHFAESLGGNKSKGNVYFNRSWPNSDIASVAAVEDWQILTPYRSRSTGADTLNRAIHSTYRKPRIDFLKEQFPYARKIPAPVGPQEITYGDKVICVRNHRNYSAYPRDEYAQQYVANGEIGLVVGENKFGKRKLRKAQNLEVEFSSQVGYTYKFYPNQFNGESDPPIELAYSLTIHKAQGSEFDKVFLVIPNPCGLLSTELIYTALTRQKSKVILFHQGELLDLKTLSQAPYAETTSRMTGTFNISKPVQIREKYLDQYLIHRTKNNEAVRSKSEVIVADILNELVGPLYEYENPFYGKEGTVRLPDFTFSDAATGDLYLIEHLGMLKNRYYAEKWEQKLRWYRENDVLTFEEGGGERGTLIVTRDNEDGGIDAAAIRDKIKEAMDLD